MRQEGTSSLGTGPAASLFNLHDRAGIVGDTLGSALSASIYINGHKLGSFLPISSGVVQHWQRVAEAGFTSALFIVFVPWCCKSCFCCTSPVLLGDGCLLGPLLFFPGQSSNSSANKNQGAAYVTPCKSKCSVLHK